MTCLNLLNVGGQLKKLPGLNASLKIRISRRGYRLAEAA